ncbi:MAG: aminotransferase class III-fold pyridoxal phosphate-dependent enzyme, partial [Candidatus Omnitrophica bacterium]|nr:aminotransferase class III-fold pyridoxal phosphate-dependent enzyme [Candidatus Omnitrophota bacterium]
EISAKVADGRINPFINLALCKDANGSNEEPGFEEAQREIALGFLPIAANPLSWGHILIAFMSMNILSLDAAIYRVQGEIRYKNLPESDRVPVKDRHSIVKRVVKELRPLIRYTDLGSEPNNELEGFEEMYRFLELNASRKIHMYYLIGIENRERVMKYMRQHYGLMLRYSLNPNHRVTVGWIQRGEYGATITQEELGRISQDVKEETGSDKTLDVVLVKDPDIDLNVTSTYYRNSHDPAIVPSIIDQDAREHGFYGHPPIDPRTGKPYDYSEEELFRLKLRPVAESIANQAVRVIERLSDGAILVLAVDGPSGSGKTTIAEEVGKYLLLRGYQYLHIGLDLFLKEKDFRTAMEKLATGRTLSARELVMLGAKAAEITPGIFTDEEEVFFDQKAVLKLLQEIEEFRLKGQVQQSLFVPNTYNRLTKKREDRTFSLKKGTVVIIDGKYALRREFQPFCDIRYRLEDNPDRTKAKFEMRTRSLSPNTADIQMGFYEVGLIPSYQQYADRTGEAVDFYIDLKGDDWAILPAREEGHLSSSPIVKIKFSEALPYVIPSYSIKELWRIEKDIKTNSYDLHGEFNARESNTALGTLFMNIDNLAASCNTCWLKAAIQGQRLGREMAARAFLAAQEISAILGLNTRFAHAYFTLSFTEEEEQDNLSPTILAQKNQRRYRRFSMFREMGLVERKLQGKDHLNGYYDRYFDHLGNLSDVAATIIRNWRQWFYLDRASKHLTDVERKILERIDWDSIEAWQRVNERDNKLRLYQELLAFGNSGELQRKIKELTTSSSPISGGKAWFTSEAMRIALAIAETEYKGKQFSNGEYYLEHVFRVRNVVAQLSDSEVLVIAAILHKVEPSRLKELLASTTLSKDLAERIVLLVEKLHLINRLIYRPPLLGKYNIQNFMDKIIKICGEYEVMLLVLADKLASIQNIIPANKEEYILHEIEDIYPYLAERLGMDQLAGAFGNELFRISQPEKFVLFESQINTLTGSRNAGEAELKLMGLAGSILKELESRGVDARALSRRKHSSLAWEKLIRKQDKYKELEDLPDLLSITFIGTIDFHVLFAHIMDIIQNKLLHSDPILFSMIKPELKPIEVGKGRLSRQKWNIDFLMPDGTAHEIQVMDEETYHQMRSGRAAHWAYKHRARGQLFDFREVEITDNFADNFQRVNASLPYIYVDVPGQEKRADNHEVPLIFVPESKARKSDSTLALKTFRLPAGATILDLLNQMGKEAVRLKAEVVPLGSYYWHTGRQRLFVEKRISRSLQYALATGDLVLLFDSGRPARKKSVLKSSVEPRLLAEQLVAFMRMQASAYGISQEIELCLKNMDGKKKHRSDKIIENCVRLQQFFKTHNITDRKRQTEILKIARVLALKMENAGGSSSPLHEETLATAKQLVDFMQSKGRSGNILVEIRLYLDQYSLKSTHRTQFVKEHCPRVTAFFELQGITDKTEQSNILYAAKAVIEHFSSSPLLFSASADAIDQDFVRTLEELNALGQEYGHNAVIARVLSDAPLKEKISLLVKAQDRQDETSGYAVDAQWAEEFKEAALKEAVDTLKDRDIVVLQMEYELSMRFLFEFKEYLARVAGYTEEKAVYATGELAKLLMAGGLGSFKPDLVQGWYNVLRKFWGSTEARNRLHVMGIFYANAIKGQGAIESEIVRMALESLDKVATYKGVEINMNGVGKVDVDIYVNPYSELHEYWMYCPAVFHEAYPGSTNDEFRAVQSLLYRIVVLRFIKDLAQKGEFKKQMLFSTSEVNTTLAVPCSRNDEFKDDPIFEDVMVHHYNHTIVPAGIPYLPWYMFDALRIAEEYRYIVHDGIMDYIKLTGAVSDVITGCSSMHTQICRILYKDFLDKVTEDSLFGNSEGSDIERWQGKRLKELIGLTMKKLGARDYKELFWKLEANPKDKEEFIQGLLARKKAQKQLFINELSKGTFGSIGLTTEELTGILDKPVFTFVRRMVDYKCADLIVDVLYDQSLRERIIKAGAVIVIGGRKFSMFSEAQHRRINELIAQDARMKGHIVFISNHNIFTSWIIQQGTDFGGMLSWKGKEAGPTSFGNAQVNGSPSFASPDGVIVERVKPIVRDGTGKVVKGTGYIVAYGNERAYTGDIKPGREAFVSQLEAACSDYYSGNYGTVAFNALQIGMTEGDITQQAKGLVMAWARTLNAKENAGSSPLIIGRMSSAVTNLSTFPAPLEKSIQGILFYLPWLVGNKFRSSTGRGWWGKIASEGSDRAAEGFTFERLPTAKEMAQWLPYLTLNWLRLALPRKASTYSLSIPTGPMSTASFSKMTEKSKAAQAPELGWMSVRKSPVLSGRNFNPFLSRRASLPVLSNRDNVISELDHQRRLSQIIGFDGHAVKGPPTYSLSAFYEFSLPETTILCHTVLKQNPFKIQLNLQSNNSSSPVDLTKLSEGSTINSEAIKIRKARGVYLWDVDCGKRYLDLFSQTWSLPLGHNNKKIINAVRDQLNKITHLRTAYYTEEKSRLVEEIIELSPSGLTKVNFVLHGSLAVEG